LRSYYVKYLNFPIDIKKKYDVVFIGHYENDNRDQWLKYLIDNGIKLKIFGPEWHRSSYFEFFKKKIGNIHPLNLTDYNTVLNSSKIALVFLSTLNSDTYTRRCFEIPASKTFMLSQYSNDLQSLFESEVEADYFNSQNEMLEKILFYLENEKVRDKIANSAFEKVTFEGHEVSQRVRIILNQYNKDMMNINE
jgi:spore maturation protein CgeB